jgi:hypothetical protein
LREFYFDFPAAKAAAPAGIQQVWFRVAAKAAGPAPTIVDFQFAKAAKIFKWLRAHSYK